MNITTIEKQWEIQTITNVDPFNAKLKDGTYRRIVEGTEEQVRSFINKYFKGIGTYERHYETNRTSDLHNET